MEKYLRAGAVDELSQRGVVAYIANLMLRQAGGNFAFFEELRCAIGRKAVSVHFGTKVREPQGQPRTLETHVPGYQHALAAVEVAKLSRVKRHPCEFAICNLRFAIEFNCKSQIANCK